MSCERPRVAAKAAEVRVVLGHARAITGTMQSSHTTKHLAGYQVYVIMKRNTVILYKYFWIIPSFQETP